MLFNPGFSDRHTGARLSINNQLVFFSLHSFQSSTCYQTSCPQDPVSTGMGSYPGPHGKGICGLVELEGGLACEVAPIWLEGHKKLRITSEKTL